MKPVFFFLFLLVADCFAASGSLEISQDIKSAFDIVFKTHATGKLKTDVYMAEMLGLLRDRDSVFFSRGQKQWFSVHRKFSKNLESLDKEDQTAFQEAEERRWIEKKSELSVDPLHGRNFFDLVPGARFYARLALNFLNQKKSDVSWYLFDQLSQVKNLPREDRFSFLILAAFAAKKADYSSLTEKLIELARLLGESEEDIKRSAEIFSTSFGWDWRNFLFGNPLPAKITFETLTTKIMATQGQAMLSEEYLEMLFYDALDPELSRRRMAVGLLLRTDPEVLAQLSLKTRLPKLFQATMENLSNEGIPSDIRAFGLNERIGGFSKGRLFSIDGLNLISRDLDTGVKLKIGVMPYSEFDPVITLPPNNDKVLAVYSKSKISGAIFVVEGNKITASPIMNTCDRDKVREVAFSADGNTVAVKCVHSPDFDKIMVFSNRDNKPNLIFTSPTSHSFSQVQVSPKGKYLAAYVHSTKGGLSTKLTIWAIEKEKEVFSKELTFSRLTQIIDRVKTCRPVVFPSDESNFAVQWKSEIHLLDLNEKVEKRVIATEECNSPKRDCIILHPTKDELRWIEFTSEGVKFRQRNLGKDNLTMGKFSPSAAYAFLGEKLFYLNPKHQLTETYLSNSWHPEEIKEPIKERKLSK